MLFGTGGMCVCSGLVVLFTLLTKTGNQIFMWCNLAAVFGIMGSFSVAPGPVPWLITAELFTQGPRAAAMSLAGATNWIMTFLVGLAFESVLVSTSINLFRSPINLFRSQTISKDLFDGKFVHLNISVVFYEHFR